MQPEQMLAALDFRYISDALSPQEALDILYAGKSGQDQRLIELYSQEYPAYTTSVGWFGFSDDKIRSLCRKAMSEGWTNFKLKVGGEPEDDLRRGRIVREEIGWTNRLMVDANQEMGSRRSYRSDTHAGRAKAMVDGRADKSGRHPRTCAN
jgi:L-fuconate dehydratase